MPEMPGQGKDSKLRIEEGEPFPMAWGMELPAVDGRMTREWCAWNKSFWQLLLPSSLKG
jgi:hypothetical protein